MLTKSLTALYKEKKNFDSSYKIAKQTHGNASGLVLQSPDPVAAANARDADILVAPNEIVEQHGTGVLLKRLFGSGKGLVTIRSFDHYGGKQEFGEENHVFSYPHIDRRTAFVNVLNHLGHVKPRRIFCVPFFAGDFLTAWAIKQVSNSPMAIYIMDDQFIDREIVPRWIVQSALASADIRFAISPEMRDAYETQFGLRFHLLPPLADADLVRNSLMHGDLRVPDKHKGVLVGSIWNPAWLQTLAATLQQAGLHLDWYGNYTESFHGITKDELETMGITIKGILPEDKLVSKLADYAYAVVPLGTGDSSDEWNYITRYSLQTRVAFLVTTANIPLLCCGDIRSANASFIRKFDLGESCPYNADAYSKAVESLKPASRQKAIRENARRLAPKLVLDHASEWIWKSTKLGIPATPTFDELFKRDESNLTPFLDTPVPRDVPWFMQDAFLAIRRLARIFPDVDCVIDVGASTGVWSHYVKKHIFPKARFVLVEPLIESHKLANSYYRENNPEFEWVECALSDTEGSMEMNISQDLYGSSIMRVEDGREYVTKMIPIRRLDNVAEDLALMGTMTCALLKVDVQGAEHLVLKGAGKALEGIHHVVLELSLVAIAKDALLIDDMIAFMKSLGFRMFDEAGEWRSPIDGMLIQRDVIFTRN